MSKLLRDDNKVSLEEGAATIRAREAAREARRQKLKEQQTRPCPPLYISER